MRVARNKIRTLVWSTVLLTGILSLQILGVGLHTANAASPSNPASFSHVVMIAMENQNYGSVIGSSSAPFINSLASLGTTISSYHSYGQGIGGCSAGCYTAITSGGTWGVSDGVGSGSVSQPNIFSQISFTQGLTWKAFCENNCPRNGDHFPPLQYANTYGSTCASASSENCYEFTCASCSSSTVSDTQLVAELNSATPANFIWFTPTDAHNMHDVSVSTGDSYLQQIMVGSGSIASPAAGSILASSLFKQPGTFLYLWWDEYDPSPNVEYGSMIKVGYTSTVGVTEYDSLHTFEANWGLPYLTSTVSGDAGMTDIFTSGPPPPPTPDFSLTPNSTSLTFQPSGSGTVSIAAAFLNGLTTAIGLTATSPSGITVSCSPTTLTTTTLISSCKFSGTGSGTATITGTAGTLTHALSITVSATTVGTGTFVPSQWTILGSGGSINSNGVFHIDFSSTGSWGFTGAACAGCPFESQIPVSSSSFINARYLHLSGKVISASSLGQAMYVETSIYYQLDQTGLSVPLLDTETQATHWENGAYASAGYSYVGSGSDSTHGTYSAWREVTVETQPGSTFDYTIDMYALAQRGIAGLGLPSGTTVHLVRVEPGVEGYGVVSVDYYTADMSGTWPTGGTPVPDFGLVSTPATISIPAGSSGFTTLTMTSLNGYTDTLTLSTSAPGTGISSSTSPASLSLSSSSTSTSTLTVSTTTSATAGTYSLVVTVAGTALSHQVTIQVSITAPSGRPLSALITSSPTAGQVNQTMTFSATAVNGAQPYSFMWDFGDGSAATGTTASHAYAAPGNYTVTLIVTDSASVTASVQKIVNITASTITSLLSLTVPGSESASMGSLLTFTITASSQAGQGPVTLFANNLPPGATFTSTSGNPATGTFSWKPDQSVKSGTYTVTFNAVQAASANQASKTVTIAYAAAPGNPCVLVCGLSPVISSTISLVTLGAVIGLLGSLVLVRFAAYGRRRRDASTPVSVPLASVSSMPTRVAVTPLYGAMRKPFGTGSRIPELHRHRQMVLDDDGSELEGVRSRTRSSRKQRAQQQ